MRSLRGQKTATVQVVRAAGLPTIGGLKLGVNPHWVAPRADGDRATGASLRAAKRTMFSAMASFVFGRGGLIHVNDK